MYDIGRRRGPKLSSHGSTHSHTWTISIVFVSTVSNSWILWHVLVVLVRCMRRKKLRIFPNFLLAKGFRFVSTLECPPSFYRAGPKWNLGRGYWRVARQFARSLAR